MNKRELVDKTTFSNSIWEICSLVNNAFNRLEQLNDYRIQTEDEKRVLSKSRRQLMNVREQLGEIALKYTEEVEKEKEQ
jgi:hypothetical protein